MTKIMAAGVYGLKLILILLCALMFDTNAQNFTSFSAYCTKNGSAYSCTVGAFEESPWTSRATLDSASINTTGWGRLVIEINHDEGAYEGAFASGFIEGYISRELIDLSCVNQETYPSKKAAKFINESIAWVKSQASEKGQQDAVFFQAGLVLLQQDGLYAGYAAASTDKPALTYDQLLHYGMQDELGDIESAVNAEKRPNFANMTESELMMYIFIHDHCSAMVKITADFSEIFSSHVTWYDYSSMLRLFKSFMTVSATGEPVNSTVADIHYSGYPGKMASSDDFYFNSQKIVIWETTNNIFNTSLYDEIIPQSIPYFIRISVATRLATTAQNFHNIFYQHNSGTYNNQWASVDYKLFTPGQPLPPNLLWVSEQLPGYCHAEDQTMVLQRGYWPSYNVPFYDDIYKMSGYPEIARASPELSYQLAPRASLFRRDGGAFNNISGMQDFMLSNHYGSGDPLAKDPFDAICKCQLAYFNIMITLECLLSIL